MTDYWPAMFTLEDLCDITGLTHERQLERIGRGQGPRVRFRHEDVEYWLAGEASKILDCAVQECERLISSSESQDRGFEQQESGYAKAIELLKTAQGLERLIRDISTDAERMIRDIRTQKEPEQQQKKPEQQQSVAERPERVREAIRSALAEHFGTEDRKLN